MRRTAAWVLVIVLGTAAVLAVHQRIAGFGAVANLDLWYLLQQAQALDPLHPATLADGLYPLGLPVLLRAGLALGADAVVVGRIVSVVGRIVSVVGLVLGIVGAGLLAVALEQAREGRDRTCSAWNAALVSALVVLVVLSNRALVHHAWFEGTDMIAAGLQVLGLGVLARGVVRGSSRAALAAGALFGAAYLFRYTAILMVLAVCAALLGPALRARRPGPLGRVLAGFALVAAPQLVASLAAHGTPFYSLQAKNVWFGIHGRGDYLGRWSSVPNDIGLGAVFWMDPGAMLRHWLGELVRCVSEPALHGWPSAWLLGVMLAGLGVVAASAKPPVRGLVLWPIALIPAAIGLAWLHERFLLPVLFVEAALVAHAARMALRALGRFGARRWELEGIGAVLVALSVAAVGLANARSLAASHAREDVAWVAATVAELGVVRAEEVGTNNPYFHDATSPARTRYGQINSIAPQAATLDDLLRDPRTCPWTLLVLDWASPHGDLSALREAMAGDGRVLRVAGRGTVELFSLSRSGCCVDGGSDVWRAAMMTSRSMNTIPMAAPLP